MASVPSYPRAAAAAAAAAAPRSGKNKDTDHQDTQQQDRQTAGGRSTYNTRGGWDIEEEGRQTAAWDFIVCYLRVYQKSVMDDVGELVGGCTGQFTKAEMHVREAAIKTGLEIALKRMDARVDNLRKQAKPMVVTNSSVNSLVSRQNKFIQDELSVKLGLVEGKRLADVLDMDAKKKKERFIVCKQTVMNYFMCGVSTAEEMSSIESGLEPVEADVKFVFGPQEPAGEVQQDPLSAVRKKALKNKNKKLRNKLNRKVAAATGGSSGSGCGSGGIVDDCCCVVENGNDNDHCNGDHGFECHCSYEEILEPLSPPAVQHPRGRENTPEYATNSAPGDLAAASPGAAAATFTTSSATASSVNGSDKGCAQRSTAVDSNSVRDSAEVSRAGLTCAEKRWCICELKGGHEGVLDCTARADSKGHSSGGFFDEILRFYEDNDAREEARRSIYIEIGKNVVRNSVAARAVSSAVSGNSKDKTFLELDSENDAGSPFEDVGLSAIGEDYWKQNARHEDLMSRLADRVERLNDATLEFSGVFFDSEDEGAQNGGDGDGGDDDDDHDSGDDSDDDGDSGPPPLWSDSDESDHQGSARKEDGKQEGKRMDTKTSAEGGRTANTQPIAKGKRLIMVEDVDTDEASCAAFSVGIKAGRQSKNCKTTLARDNITSKRKKKATVKNASASPATASAQHSAAAGAKAGTKKVSSAVAAVASRMIDDSDSLASASASDRKTAKDSARNTEGATKQTFQKDSNSSSSAHHNDINRKSTVPGHPSLKSAAPPTSRREPETAENANRSAAATEHAPMKNTTARNATRARTKTMTQVKAKGAASAASTAARISAKSRDAGATQTRTGAGPVVAVCKGTKTTAAPASASGGGAGSGAGNTKASGSAGKGVIGKGARASGKRQLGGAEPCAGWFAREDSAAAGEAALGPRPGVASAQPSDDSDEWLVRGGARGANGGNGRKRGKNNNHNKGPGAAFGKGAVVTVCSLDAMEAAKMDYGVIQKWTLAIAARQMTAKPAQIKRYFHDRVDADVISLFIDNCRGDYRAAVLHCGENMHPPIVVSSENKHPAASAPPGRQRGSDDANASGDNVDVIYSDNLLEAREEEEDDDGDDEEEDSIHPLVRRAEIALAGDFKDIDVLRGLLAEAHGVVGLTPLRKMLKRIIQHEVAAAAAAAAPAASSPTPAAAASGGEGSPRNSSIYTDREGNKSNDIATTTLTTDNKGGRNVDAKNNNFNNNGGTIIVTSFPSSISGVRVMNVPSDAVGWVLGKNRAYADNIQRKTGAQLDVGAGGRLTMKCSPGQIAAAEAEVSKLMNNAECPSSVKSSVRNHIARFQSSGNAAQKAADFAKRTLRCPHNRVQRLVGNNRANLRKVQRLSGANVEVFEQFPDGESRAVIVGGALERVEKAVNMLFEIVGNELKIDGEERSTESCERGTHTQISNHNDGRPADTGCRVRVGYKGGSSGLADALIDQGGTGDAVGRLHNSSGRSGVGNNGIHSSNSVNNKNGIQHQDMVGRLHQKGNNTQEQGVPAPPMSQRSVTNANHVQLQPRYFLPVDAPPPLPPGPALAPGAAKAPGDSNGNGSDWRSGPTGPETGCEWSTGPTGPPAPPLGVVVSGKAGKSAADSSTASAAVLPPVAPVAEQSVPAHGGTNSNITHGNSVSDQNAGPARADVVGGTSGACSNTTATVGTGGAVAAAGEVGDPKMLEEVLRAAGCVDLLPRFLKEKFDVKAVGLMDDKDFEKMKVPKGPQLKIQHACTQRLEKLGLLDGNDNKGSGKEKDKKVDPKNKGDSDGKCGICWVGEVQVTFVPCGHQMCCIPCGMPWVKRPCPTCRRTVEQAVRFYM